MSEIELRMIALRFFDKGYNQHDKLKESDDLYNSSPEDRDLCCMYLDEIEEHGSKVQQELIDRLIERKDDSFVFNGS